jgi:hypothetical protein
MSKPTFPSILERDQELAALQRRQQENLANLQATEVSLAELDRAIEAGPKYDVARLASDIAAGITSPAPVSIAALRDEYAQHETNRAVYELADKKLVKAIAARKSDLADQYAITRIDEVRARVGRIVDSALTIAEVSREDQKFQAALEAEGFPAQRIPSGQYRINGGHFGTWPNEFMALTEMFKRYGALTGFKPTPEQTRRLAALAP